MSDEQQQIESPDAPPSLVGRIRRAFAGVRRSIVSSTAGLYRFRRLIIVSGCGLFLLASALATVSYVQSVRARALAEGLTIEAALEHLDNGEYAEARRLARLIPAAKNLRRDELGEVHFVIGAATAYETDKAWDEPNRAKFYALAAKYLLQAEDRRYPEGRTVEGRLLLGRSLIQSGEYEAALAPLLLIGNEVPIAKAEADRMLAIAYLSSRTPQLDKAASHAQAFAQASQAISQNGDRAALLQGEIALAQGTLDSAQEFFDQVPDESELINERQMLRGQLALHRANVLREKSLAEGVTEVTPETQALYGKSIELMREALSHHASGQGLSSKASYLIGTALRRQGQAEAARDQFFRTRKRYYDTPEALVSSLQEAEIHLELGNLEAGSAALNRTASLINSPEQLANPYTDAKEVRKLVERGFDVFYRNQRFDLAAKLAQSIKPLVGPQMAAKLEAQTLHRWGRHLQAQADNVSGEEADELYRKSRKKFRLAGYAYTSLAHQLYITREYPNALWQAGENFNEGRDFESATIVLSEYLETEARTERPLVLIALTKAYLSLSKIDKAIDTIETCLREFSRDPSVYRARLLASTTYLEAGKTELAREMLEANLHQEALTPRSDVWRDSLFALGALLHNQGRAAMAQPQQPVSDDPLASRQLHHLERGHELLHEAIRRLSEAVARYPDASQVTRARYDLAESYRYGSQMPLAKFELETIDSRRSALNRQISEELHGALKQYDELVRIMNEKSHVGGNLSEEEEKILRNIYFSRGTVLYDLGDYESAIKAYSTATSRYQHEPAALEAYVQIAACYRRLNKPLEARGTLEQAKLVIERISEQQDFTSTTRFDRGEWNTLLDWLSSL